MNKALTIFRKYPPLMIIRNDNSLQKKLLEITKPKKIKQKEITFCPIWIRKFF